MEAGSDCQRSGISLGDVEERAGIGRCLGGRSMTVVLSQAKRLAFFGSKELHTMASEDVGLQNQPTS